MKRNRVRHSFSFDLSRLFRLVRYRKRVMSMFVSKLVFDVRSSSKWRFFSRAKPDATFDLRQVEEFLSIKRISLGDRLVIGGSILVLIDVRCAKKKQFNHDEVHFRSSFLSQTSRFHRSKLSRNLSSSRTGDRSISIDNERSRDQSHQINGNLDSTVFRRSARRLVRQSTVRCAKRFSPTTTSS